jgi:hypothetical protein
MLTELTLENFKAIGTRVTLPLAPITLLFGGNSAGKSSVFHALHLAREVLTRGNLDPDRTEMGGGSLDLGGFANLVHRHQLDRAVRLGFTLRDLAWPDAPTFDDRRGEADDEAVGDEGPVPSGIPFHHEGDDDRTRVVLELRWSHVDGRARVTGFEVARGDQPRPALRIEAALDGRDVRLTEVDVWQFRVDPEAPKERGDPALEAVIASLQPTPRPADHPWAIAVYGQDQALPPRDRPLCLWAPGGDDADVDPREVQRGAGDPLGEGAGDARANGGGGGGRAGAAAPSRARGADGRPVLQPVQDFVWGCAARRAHGDVERAE